MGCQPRDQPKGRWVLGDLGFPGEQDLLDQFQFGIPRSGSRGSSEQALGGTIVVASPWDTAPGSRRTCQLILAIVSGDLGGRLSG